jgi:ABC-type phosphate transport system substrate-binding protein
MKMKFQLGIGAILVAASSAALAGAVIVAKDSPVSAMDADQAKRVFLGREVSLGGHSTVVVYQKDETVRTAFETKVLGKTGSELSAYWSKQIFTGKAMAPEEVTGDAQVRAKVATTPGAIGYVTDSGVDSTVKVIFKY